MKKNSMYLSLSVCLVMMIWTRLVHPAKITTPNKKPVIGIVTQELESDMIEVMGNKGCTSHIPSSYVKYFESGGAQVIPVFIGKEDDYYRPIVESVSGLVFPDGGGESFSTTESLYGLSVEKIYRLVMERVEKTQIEVPIMAISTGFQWLMYYSSEKMISLTDCDADDLARRLTIKDRQKCQLFGEAPEDVMEAFSNYDSTSNFNNQCINKESFNAAGLDENFNILSTSVDRNDMKYISTVEHKILPIYGLQWQPQMNSFEWVQESIPKDRMSIRAVQYVANFFVDKARNVPQKFESNDLEELLIYNFETLFTNKLFASRHMECYCFK